MVVGGGAGRGLTTCGGGGGVGDGGFGGSAAGGALSGAMPSFSSSVRNFLRTTCFALRFLTVD